MPKTMRKPSRVPRMPEEDETTMVFPARSRDTVKKGVEKAIQKKKTPPARKGRY